MVLLISITIYVRNDKSLQKVINLIVVDNYFRYQYLLRKGFKMKAMLLALSIGLAGCGASSDSGSATDAISYEQIGYGDTGYNILGEGRSIRVLGSADFEDSWSAISSEDIPDVDFSDSVVILFYDGETSTSECASNATLKSLTAELDEKDTLTTSVEYEINCVDSALVCDDVLNPEYNYKFYKINTNPSNIVLNEQYTYTNCD
jgi:hypothetical protein